jgi:hypothetical protein
VTENYAFDPKAVIAAAVTLHRTKLRMSEMSVAIRTSHSAFLAFQGIATLHTNSVFIRGIQA